MADPAPGKEGFHPLSARKTGEELPEVLPLHQPTVTIAEPFNRALTPRTPMMEEPRNSPIMPVLTPQPQDGISTQQPTTARHFTPQTENFPPQTRNFTILWRAYRLCAYRLYTSCVYGRLGPHCRRVIPARVLTTIRAAFPADHGQYTGFMEASGDDLSMWPWWSGNTYRLRQSKGTSLPEHSL